MKAIKPLLVLVGMVLLMACNDAPTSPTLDDCVGLRRCVQPEFAPDPKRLTVRLDSTGQVITSSTTTADTVLLRGDIITQGGFDSARVRLFRNGVQTNSNGTKTKAVSYRKVAPLANDSVQWKQTWEVWRGTGKRTGGDSIWVYGPKTSTPPPPPPPDTTTPPDTVTPPPPPPANGIAVTPGQSIQSAVNAAPEGATFILRAGRHVRQSVTPKHGQTFRCEPGAVLDGERVAVYAFQRSGSNPDNVSIIGCRITRYAPPFQYGAILAGGAGSADGTSGWLLDSVQVDSTSSGGAVRLGHRMRILRSRFLWNAAIGLVGVGDDVLVEGNEIAWNNAIIKTPPGNEHGGTKFVATNRLIVRNNWVHHNWGPGLWTDINNYQSLYEGNLSEDNFGEGIVHEISYDAVIRNNTLRRNGLTDSRGNSWLWGAGIGVHSSPNVEVYGNVLEGNRHGIAGIQQSRGSGNRGVYEVRNLWVHDNVIVFSNSNQRHGLAADFLTGSVWTSGYNNRFQANTYRFNGTGVIHFDWNGGSPGSDVRWRGFGHDVTGVFTP